MFSNQDLLACFGHMDRLAVRLLFTIKARQNLKYLIHLDLELRLISTDSLNLNLVHDL